MTINKEMKVEEKKRAAAFPFRFALNIKSSVFPSESTARYRYFPSPLTSMYVSSTRHESFVGFKNGQMFLSSLGQTSAPTD